MFIELALICEEVGLANKGKHHLLLVHTLVHDKRGITESLQVCIYRDRLIVWTDIALKTDPTPFFEELVEFITCGLIFNKLQYVFRKKMSRVCC